MDRSDAAPKDEPLGAYQVVRQLRGAERDIYLARKGLGAPEQLLVVVEGNVADRARLKAELARLRGVEHDAILKPVETFTLKGNRTVLVFGDFSGASLHRVMVQLQNDSERMALTAVCYIGARIAEALAAAHGATDDRGALAPIVHAHVAPEQVLLAWSGAVRLLGLGLGPFMEPSRLEARERGTEPYVAPELRGKDAPATIEANVYSHAAMVWALFSGRDPPAKVKAAPVRSVRTDVPARISDAIERNMSPDPAARDVSCRELGELLGEIGARKGRDELRWNLEVFRALIAIGDDDVTSLEAFPVSRPRPGAAPAEREPAPPSASDDVPTPRVTDKELAGGPARGASTAGVGGPAGTGGGSVRDRLAKARGTEKAAAGKAPVPPATRGAGTLRGMARGEVPKTPAGAHAAPDRAAPGKQSRSPSSFERPRGFAAKDTDDARREEEEQNYTPGSEDSVTMVRGWHEKLAKDAQAAAAADPQGTSPATGWAPATAGSAEAAATAPTTPTVVQPAAAEPAPAAAPVPAPLPWGTAPGALVTPQPIPQPIPAPPSPPTAQPEGLRDREVPLPAASAPGETPAPPPRTRRSLESLLDAAGRGTKAPRAGASMTAMIVGASIFGAGVVVGTLVLRSLVSGGSAATPSPASPSGPEPGGPTAPPAAAVASRPAAATSTVPTASAPPPTSVSASARTSSEPAPSASADDGDPSKLPADEGYLFVEARPVGAFVYVDGAKTGPTSRNLRVRCGDLHVRLGIMRPGRMTWVSGSRTVPVACRAVTTVDIPISQNPSPEPTRPGWVPHGI